MTTPNEKPLKNQIADRIEMRFAEEHLFDDFIGVRPEAAMGMEIDQRESAQRILLEELAPLDSLASENARLRAALEKIVQNWKDGELHSDSANVAMEALKK